MSDIRTGTGSIILDAIKAIAQGRLDNGRPLAAEAARELARKALTECGVSWDKRS